jgi:transcription antitermination factor NusG
MAILQWYAFSVKANHESAVTTALASKGYEAFLPVRRSRRSWSDRNQDIQTPLFRGYTFCRCDLLSRTVPIMTTPGIVRIVGFGGTPVPVEPHEIEAVRRVVDSGLGAEPWPYLQPGSVVRITRGALAGLEGALIQVKTNYQLVVSISLLQRSIAVQVDAGWVTPAPPPESNAPDTKQ